MRTFSTAMEYALHLREMRTRLDDGGVKGIDFLDWATRPEGARWAIPEHPLLEEMGEWHRAYRVMEYAAGVRSRDQGQPSNAQRRGREFTGRRDAGLWWAVMVRGYTRSSVAGLAGLGSSRVGALVGLMDGAVMEALGAFRIREVGA